MKNTTIIPHEAHHYYQKAIHSQHKESPEKILEYFDRAIAAQPGHAMAWNEKANFLDYLGMPSHVTMWHSSWTRNCPRPGSTRGLP